MSNAHINQAKDTAVNTDSEYSHSADNRREFVWNWKLNHSDVSHGVSVFDHKQEAFLIKASAEMCSDCSHRRGTVIHSLKEGLLSQKSLSEWTPRAQRVFMSEMGPAVLFTMWKRQMGYTKSMILAQSYPICKSFIFSPIFGRQNTWYRIWDLCLKVGVSICAYHSNRLRKLVSRRHITTADS